MNMTALTLFKTTLTATALTLAMSGAASASGTWDGGTNVGTLNPGSTLTSTAANANKNAWSDNSALTYNAWGMNGGWLSFNLTSTATTTVSATSNGSLIAPAFTLYRTDVPWTGSTVGTSGGTNGTLMSFSGVALVGQNGIGWAVSPLPTPNATGVVETLGYANSGPAHLANAFGQTVYTGAHDVSMDNLYETGINGSTGAGLASLTLQNLVAGNYTIFVSGANSALAGGPINVNVSAVPLPGAVWLFGSALVGLIGAKRRKVLS